MVSGHGISFLSCACEMCTQCKQNQFTNLKIIDHDVVLYREKFNTVQKQEICVRYFDSVYGENYEPCKFPDCENCTEHIHI